MSRLIFILIIIVCILAGLFMWGLSQSSEECKRHGSDYELRVDGSYMRCVNDSGEVREL